MGGNEGANKSITSIYFRESITSVDSGAFSAYGANPKLIGTTGYTYASTVDVYFYNVDTAPEWWTNKETVGFYESVQPQFIYDV